MNAIAFASGKPLCEICTTTLAQDAFNLYHTVIADVTERIKGDLMKLGKSESEVKTVTKLLSTRWKRALDESHCIDHENLIGINLNDIARNIGQENRRKRQKLNDEEVGGQFVAPSLPAGGNLLAMGKGIPSVSEVSNPYLAGEDFNEQNVSTISTTLNSSCSNSASPKSVAKKVRISVKSEPDVVKDKESSLPVKSIEDIDFNSENFQKTIEKPLGSDDDDSEGDDEDPTDLVVCAYSRVMKKRGNWNMDLKNGLIHFAGKDYAFKEAKGGHLKW